MEERAIRDSGRPDSAVDLAAKEGIPGWREERARRSSGLAESVRGRWVVGGGAAKNDRRGSACIVPMRLGS